MKDSVNNNHGFTLIELMIVMIILGILATIGFTSFQNSQKKGRDTRRKNDLRQISLALETYYNDYGKYPSGLNGNIKGCGDPSSAVVCNWGTIFKYSLPVGTNYPTYMIKLPKDPKSNWYYYYKSSGSSTYQLYASFENADDPDFVSAGFGTTPPSCSTGILCTYGISSSNATP